MIRASARAGMELYPWLGKKNFCTAPSPSHLSRASTGQREIVGDTVLRSLVGWTLVRAAVGGQWLLNPMEMFCELS